MSAPRLFLIVEDDRYDLSIILKNLRAAGFKGPRVYSAKPELYVFQRGRDQVHITSFLETGAQAIKDHEYICAFTDVMVNSTRSYMGVFRDTALRLMHDKPLCKLFVISSESPENMRARAGELNLSAELEAREAAGSLVFFGKQPGRVVKEILAMLEMRRSKPISARQARNDCG
jgi:hypothetical protein